MLASEPVASERRTRTLGLGAAVRAFNDLAVPGMGGVWFGKQLFLATLGVAVCEQARRNHPRLDNIKVTNAIEALACWMQHQASGDVPDERLRGIRKLRGVAGQPVFADFARAGFYVSQPMRMATVQAVKALGLVDSVGERFNSYHCTSAGSAFIAAVVALRHPHKRDALSVLTEWVCGGNINVNTDTMREILSPTSTLQPEAADYLRELIVRGDGSGPARRRAALDWVGSLQGAPVAAASVKPPALGDEHWHDVQAGALFFALQAQAYTVLDAIEVAVAAGQRRPLSLQRALVPAVCAATAALRASAGRYLAHGFLDQTGTGANAFAHACASDTDLDIVKQLVERDGRVLCLRDAMVVPGPAFDDGAVPDDPDESAASASSSNFPLPNDVSYRLRNLYRLNLDLGGQLDSWLSKPIPPTGTRHGQA